MQIFGIIYGIAVIVTAIIIGASTYRSVVFKHKMLREYNEYISEGFSERKTRFAIRASIFLMITCMSVFWPLSWIIILITTFIK